MYSATYERMSSLLLASYDEACAIMRLWPIVFQKR